MVNLGLKDAIWLFDLSQTLKVSFIINNIDFHFLFLLHNLLLFSFLYHFDSCLLILDGAGDSMLLIYSFKLLHFGLLNIFLLISFILSDLVSKHGLLASITTFIVNLLHLQIFGTEAILVHIFIRGMLFSTLKVIARTENFFTLAWLLYVFFLCICTSIFFLTRLLWLWWSSITLWVEFLICRLLMRFSSFLLVIKFF